MICYTTIDNQNRTSGENSVRKPRAAMEIGQYQAPEQSWVSVRTTSGKRKGLGKSP